MRDGPWWEQAVFVFETLGALLACALIATCPVWATLLLAALLGGPGLIAFPLLLLAVIVVPALLPVRQEEHEEPRYLDGYQRWGTNMGRLLRAPLSLAARRQRRRVASLGAGSSSTAVPSSLSERHQG